MLYSITNPLCVDIYISNFRYGFGTRIENEGSREPSIAPNLTDVGQVAFIFVSNRVLVIGP